MDEQTVRLSAEDFRRIMPAGTQAIIVAELERDTSDIQTDYFGSVTEQTVVIGFSRHTRDLFAEMRQAAARFEPTAHLGPGLDRYTARVVVASAEFGSGHYPGWYSPWHREMYPDGFNAPEFRTRAEADAFIAAAGQPHDISDQGKRITFEWQIGCESVEHREKWSMGHGYYLGHDRHSGWQVRKICLSERTEHATVARYLTERQAVPVNPVPSHTGTVRGVTLTENREKGGIEIRFPAKPHADVLAMLKSYGWRWSRFGGCWWHRDTPDARIVAKRIMGEDVTEIEAGTAPDLDRMVEDANAAACGL